MEERVRNSTRRKVPIDVGRKINDFDITNDFFVSVVKKLGMFGRVRNSFTRECQASIKMEIENLM